MTCEYLSVDARSALLQSLHTSHATDADTSTPTTQPTDHRMYITTATQLYHSMSQTHSMCLTSDTVDWESEEHETVKAITRSPLNTNRSSHVM